MHNVSEKRNHPHKHGLQKIYPQSPEFFLSRSQMLLLQTLTDPVLSKEAALTELSFAEVINIFSIRRLVFLLWVLQNRIVQKKF